MSSDKEQLDDEFTGLVESCQDQLFGYVYASVNNVADAEDLVQRTILSLWDRFDTFERGTNFAAWAITTAKHEVLNFRRLTKRRMQFTQDLMASFADAATASSQTFDQSDRRRFLHECVDELRPDDRQLLDWRYKDDQSLGQMSNRLTRSEQSVSRSLSRVRKFLFDCISRKLSQEDRP